MQTPFTARYALLVVLFLPGCNVAGAPTDVMGGLTLGVFLKQLSSDLDGVVEAARNAGRHVVIDAGRETNIAIANAQNAYNASLDKTWDKLDHTTKTSISQLNSLVNDVKNDAHIEIKSVTDKVQQYINSLPFRQHEPQLTSFTPSFIVPSINDYPVRLHFQGNFEFAKQADFAPSLEVNKKRFTPATIETQTIEFLVPIKELFRDAAPAKPELSECQLTVPWDEVTGLFSSHHRHNDGYRVIVGSLAASAGQVTITHTVKKSKQRTRRFVSNEIYQSSKSDGGNDDHKNVPYSVTPDIGWHVARGTSKFDETWSEGKDRSHSFVSDDGDHVVYQATTIYHRAGTSSAMKFKISFDEYQDYDEESNESEKFDLKWGEQKVFTYPVGSWKMSFVAFDGSPEFQAAGPSADNKYVKVAVDGSGALSISTVDPATLVWP